MKKFVFVLLSILLFAAMLAGCGGTAATEPASSAPTEAAPAATAEPLPTDVTVAVSVAPGTFDPIGPGGMSISYFTTYQIFATLYQSDATGATVPKLAVSEEKSADGTAVTIKVRTDAKFHNGDPVTVDDIVFSYNTYMTSPMGQILLNYLGPAMTKIDDETVSISLVYPNVNYKGCLSIVYIVPKAVYESDPAAFGNNPVGAGAYKFVSYTNNELVELQAFDGYFEGIAPIKTLYIKVISDPTTAAIALESGEIDVLFNVPAIDLERLAANPSLAVYKRPSDGTISLGLLRGEAMDNPKVREAIFHGINPNDALIAARNGDGTLPTDLVPAGSIGNLAGVTDYSSTYDPDLASQLLAESGFDATTPITLTLCPGYFGADASASGLSIANNLNAIGFNIVTETVDPNVCSQRWMSGDLEMMINKQGSYIMNITDVLNWYTTTGDFFGMNNAAAKSAVLDEQVNAARFALTEDAYLEAGTAMLKTFYDTYQIVPLYTANENVVYNASLSNVIVDPSAYGYVLVYYWTY
jgi:peptide/nickel transport system substrate-binding protein